MFPSHDNIRCFPVTIGGMIVCKYKKQTFLVTPKMSNEEKKQILLNKNNYIGKTAIVKHFGFTESGLPRFPIYKGYRLDNLKNNV